MAAKKPATNLGLGKTATKKTGTHAKTGGTSTPFRQVLPGPGFTIVKAKKGHTQRKK